MKKLLLGILGGISLGMLFSPKKGSDLREDLAKSDTKIKDFGEQLLEMGKNASQEMQKFLESDDTKELLAKGKVGVQELMNKGVALSDNAKQELKELTTKATEKTSDLIEEGKKVAKKLSDKI